MCRTRHTDNIERGGLACTIGSEKGENGVLGYPEADVVHHPVGCAAERLHDVEHAQCIAGVRYHSSLVVDILARDPTRRSRLGAPRYGGWGSLLPSLCDLAGQQRPGVDPYEDREEHEAIDEQIQDRAAVPRYVAKRSGGDRVGSVTEQGEQIDGNKRGTELHESR